jgi:hypothetical protein
VSTVQKCREQIKMRRKYKYLVIDNKNGFIFISSMALCDRIERRKNVAKWGILMQISRIWQLKSIVTT